jgi:hypothetical protein
VAIDCTIACGLTLECAGMCTPAEPADAALFMAVLVCVDPVCMRQCVSP